MCLSYVNIYGEHFDKSRQFWADEQDLGFGDHVLKHNSICVLTKNIFRHRLSHIQVIYLNNTS